MNQQETVRLFSQGRDAWNAWAKERLAERQALESAGEDFSAPWTLGEDGKAWLETAKADFSRYSFDEDTSFEGFRFPGDAYFGEAAFSRRVDFGKAAFSGGANFREAAFSGGAYFGGAAFSGNANFNSAEFESAADFTAIKAHSIFSMVGTKFRLVPEFAHADFKPEAPRLDTLRIEPRGFWKQTLRLVKGDSKRNPEGPGRWRVLQKLANDGHDHISEQRFFRGELLAKRGLEEQWWRAPFTFLVSLIYQVSSNFGASLIFPLLWWGTGIIGFAWFYLTEHMVRVANPEASMASATFRIWRRLWEGGEGFACIAGEGQPVFAAIGLSMSKSLFAGFGPARTLDQIHACLYGIHVRSTFESFQPVIPGWVTGIGVVQFLASAILIFLFGLALRNHFKIK